MVQQPVCVGHGVRVVPSIYSQYGTGHSLSIVKKTDGHRGDI